MWSWVGISGKLRFSQTVNTRFVPRICFVTPDGSVEIDTPKTCEWLFPDQPLPPEDFGQWQNGLICYGNFFARGRYKTPYVRLERAPVRGDMTLQLVEPVTGWEPGDRLVLPDSSADGSQRSEIVVIELIFAGDKSVQLRTACQYDHPPCLAPDGVTVLENPHVANMTRSITIKSQNASGTRGYTWFSGRGDLDISGVTFGGLGRVTELGGPARHAVTFEHLIGPTRDPGNQLGYQFKFTNNVVTCPLDPMPFLWGISLERSYYGLIQNNVIFNWLGAGIYMSERTAGNTIAGNFVCKTRGNGNRDQWELSGVGIAMRTGWQNVDTNIVCDNQSEGPYSYGIGAYQYRTSLQTFPAWIGGDPEAPGEGAVVDVNALPLLSFTGNEIYGVRNGCTFWWLGCWPGINKGPAGAVVDLKVWNWAQWGCFLYEQNALEFVRPKFLGNSGAYAFYPADYQQTDLVISDADVRGCWCFMYLPLNCWSAVRIDNAKIQVGVVFHAETPGGNQGAEWTYDRVILLNEPTLESLPGQPLVVYQGSMQTLLGNNITVHDQVHIRNWQGANYRLYPLNAEASFMMPESYLDPFGSGRKFIGCPSAGLTNAQAWARHAVCIGGTVAPATATMEPWSNALVERVA